MRMSLSRQMFIYFLVVIVFSLSMVGVFSYLESAKAIDSQVEKYISQVIDSATFQTDKHLMTYERASNSILSQDIVKRFLDMDPEDSYEYFQFTSQIKSDVFGKLYISYPTQISMIYIAGYHGKAIVDDNLSLSSTSFGNPGDKLEEMIAQTPDDGTIAIINASLLGHNRDNVITLARKIRGYSSYDVKGILALELDENQLSEVWSQVDLGKDGFFFILDNEGELVYAPANLKIDDIMGSDVPKKIMEHVNSSFIHHVNDEATMFVTRKSEYSGWSLVVSMSLDELRAPISSIQTTTITVGLIALIICLFLAMRFGNSIVKPIIILKNNMRETEKGNWTRIELKTRNDEIGGLVHSYNLMVSRLSEMIEKVYNAELENHRTIHQLQETKLERQEAEFQALQLQINPHFLYNSLETINCYAIVQDSDEITEMVEAMAFMLRYSIQTNLEEITIANELNHVRNYMLVLKHRIQREFEIEVAVPPKLLLEKMVRLTMQPIVENIMHHGFANGIEPHHVIKIDARHEGDNFLVIIEDNGMGMAEEKLSIVRERLMLNKLAESDVHSTQKSGGIGLMNVHRRIQIVFGDEYGLSIESEINKGTKVIMTMPKASKT